MEPEKTTAIVPRSNGAPPAPVGPLPQENYVNGFDGMAAAPFDAKIIEILRAPIPEMDVEIKPDGIVYLPGIFYRQRLMDAFGPGGWSIAPRSPAKRGTAAGGELVMYHGALWCLGRYVSEAVGQCVYYPNNAGMTYADAFEGAKTDCITRCCKDLGIARELWDPTWRTQWQEKHARQVMKRVQVWNEETRKKEWGEKKVWERIRREQKLAPAAPAAAPPTAATAPASTAAAKTSTKTGATVTAPGAGHDDGEAMTPEDVKNLEGLMKEMGWKRGWAKIWFKRRFAVDYTSLSKEQHKTACKLLFAFAQGPDKYNAELAAQAGAGKCHGMTEEEVTAP